MNENDYRKEINEIQIKLKDENLKSSEKINLKEKLRNLINNFSYLLILKERKHD